MTTSYHLEDELSAIDWCYEQGWTDALPVVPPAREGSSAFSPPPVAPRRGRRVATRHGRECSVQDAAINAVMAGCPSQYFSTVLAALGLLAQRQNLRCCLGRQPARLTVRMRGTVAQTVHALPPAAPPPGGARPRSGASPL